MREEGKTEMATAQREVGADVAALSDGWMKAKVELAAAEEALAYQHQQILELQMLAWKWMQAHDCLTSGRSYELPSPADLPKSIADIVQIEKIVESYVGGEYEAQGCAAEQILSDIRTLRREACEYCGPGIYTGLPNNACENCMNTGLKYPEAEAQSKPSSPSFKSK